MMHGQKNIKVKLQFDTASHFNSL